MQSVNLKSMSDIIVNLQMNNTFYWLIKHFDDRTLDHIRSRFDQTSGLKMIETFHNLQSEAIRLQGDGVSPESEKGQGFCRSVLADGDGVHRWGHGNFGKADGDGKL